MTTNPRTTNPDSIFFSSNQSYLLLKHLYKAQKAANSKFSLQYICDRIGLPSKGYLGDILSGRRKLNVANAKKLAKIFTLKGLEKKIFLIMVQKECERSLLKAKVLTKQLNSLRTQLQQGLDHFPTTVQSRLLFTRVFCAMGVFTEAPTRGKLSQLFISESNEALNQIIDQLIEYNALSETDGKLYLTNKEIMFGSGDDISTTISYLYEFMDFAKFRMAQDFGNREQCYFSSSVVSVRRRDYIEKLPQIREFFELLQTELEVASGADDLVHFNLQIFPEKIQS